MWSPNELLKTEKQRDILSYITLQFFPFKKVPLEHYPFRCFFFHCRVPRRTFRWQVLQVYLEETGDKFVKLISIDTITAYW